MQRSKEWQRNRLTNLLHNKPHILIHLVITKADHAVAACVEPVRAARIMLRGGILKVLWSVEFDGESFGKANEVDDVGRRLNEPSTNLRAFAPSVDNSEACGRRRG